MNVKYPPYFEMHVCNRLYFLKQSIKCGNLEIAKWTWSQHHFLGFYKIKFRCIPMLQWAKSTCKLKMWYLDTANIEVLQWVYNNGLWDDEQAFLSAKRAALTGKLFSNNCL